jgi:hypothetical protein
MIDFSEVRERAGYKVADASKDRVVTAKMLHEEFEPGQPPVPQHYFDGVDLSQATTKLQERLGTIIEDFPGAQNDTVLSFLLDSRGGMRGWPLVAFAGVSGWLTKELDGLGIKHEILSHTTNEWKASPALAGQIREERTAAGRQVNPGRVGSLLHVVWKEVDASADDMDKQFFKLGNMSILKDNVDGEAIEWAYGRIAARAEPNKLLFTVKSNCLDPISQATELYNGSDTSLLHRHLLNTVSAITAEGDVHLSAVILDKDSKATLFNDRSGGVSDVEVVAAYDGIYSSATHEWDELADAIIEAISASMRRSLELKSTQTPSP